MVESLPLVEHVLREPALPLASGDCDRAHVVEARTDPLGELDDVARAVHVGSLVVGLRCLQVVHRREVEDIRATQSSLVGVAQAERRLRDVALHRLQAVAGSDGLDERFKALSRPRPDEHEGLSVAPGQLAQEVATDEAGTTRYESDRRQVQRSDLSVIRPEVKGRASMRGSSTRHPSSATHRAERLWAAHRSATWIVATIAGVGLVATGVGAAAATGLFRQGGTAAAIVASSTPTPIPTARRSPASPPASVLAGLRGKIAVSLGAANTGGWITLPGGTFAPDPASNVSLPRGGTQGMTHVLGMHNWVPVKRDQVSPDGTKYAFYEYCWIQVVWPRGENFRLSAPDDGQACGMYWSVLWTANDGVYVTPASVEAVGLWWVPFSGTAREVSTMGYWTASDGRYAYGSPLAPGSG